MGKYSNDLGRNEIMHVVPTYLINIKKKYMFHFVKVTAIFTMICLLCQLTHTYLKQLTFCT
jgi:hypothetical protein